MKIDNEKNALKIKYNDDYSFESNYYTPVILPDAEGASPGNETRAFIDHFRNYNRSNTYFLDEERFFPFQTLKLSKK